MSGSQQPGSLRVLSQGDAAMPTRAAVNSYTGLVGEPVFDGQTLRMHNGTVQGGIRLLTDALLGSAAVQPAGATVASDLAGLFGRTLTVIDRGAQPNAIVNDQNGTITGSSDNSAIFNATAQYCLDNDLVMVVPPGDYFCVQPITIRCNYRGTGARLVFPNSSAVPNKVVIENRVGDTGVIDPREVRQWTGFTRRSCKLGNLGAGYLGDNNVPVAGFGSRKGQYIHVDTAAQSIMPRVGGSNIRFGEGFLVADDDGGLAHMISGNADNATWSSASVGYKIVRERLAIEGLHVVLGDNGAAGTSGAGVLNRRPNVTFKNCEVNVISTKEVAQAFADEAVCSVTHEDGRATGLKVFSTNYGWNSNLSAGIVYRTPKATHVRRGIDAHRSKHIDIESPHLPDGWGAHYAWWMSSRGGLVGASTASNPQALNLAGGGFSCVDADMPVTGAASSVVRGRSDMMELGDSVILRGNRIVIKPDGDAFRFMDFQGSTQGPNNGRTVEWPRLVGITDNVVTIHGADTVVRVIYWGLAHDATKYPFGNETSSCWHVAGNQWKFVDGGPLLGGTPRLQVNYNKNATAFGDGVSAYFADFPALFVQTQHHSGGHNTEARLSATIERIDDFGMVRWSRGAARQILVNAPRIDMSENPYSQGLAMLGDENFAHLDLTRIRVAASRFDVVLAGGTALTVGDTAATANRIQLNGGVSGAGPKLQAVGSDSNIPMEFGTRGSGPFLFNTSFTTRQFAVLHTTGAVNYPSVSGAADGGECTLGVAGSGTTGHLALTARGSASSIRSNRPHALYPCTYNTIPSASVFAGCSVRVTDRGQRTAVSDGTVWRWGDNSPV